MSLEVEMESPDSQSKPKQALTLEIPSKNEPSSSESSSPVQTDTCPSLDDSDPATTIETTHSELTTTLPTTTTNATTSSSSLTTLTVKFAPLPELLPRKRRSTVPLGMAARGQLVRRRPGYRDRNGPPMWTDEGPEEYRLQQEELAARHARFAAYAAYVAAREQEDDEDDEEDGNWPGQGNLRRGSKEGDEHDPLQVFGRMVKVAGKTLWRRVSHKDVAAAAASTKPKEGSLDGGNRYAQTGSPTLTKAPRLPPPVLRPIFGSISSNTTSHVDVTKVVEEREEDEEEGRVWEEEIQGFPLNVSQTETIIEGRAVYSRLTSKVEVLNNKSPLPTPTLLHSQKRTSFISMKIPPLKSKVAGSGE